MPMATNENETPIFVMNSLADRDRPPDRYMSTESLEDRHSTTSSTESQSGLTRSGRDPEGFIPTRMKTISASKPAADPTQFTRIPSNPLLISAQKQLLKVEEVKKKKEVISQKRGDDEPDWQSNLSSWKDRRRKQSEEALQRVAEVKALDEDEVGQRKKISIGKKLSSLMYTNGEDDWSDFGLEKNSSNNQHFDDIPKFDEKFDERIDEEVPAPPPPVQQPANIKKRTSLPAPNLGTPLRENAGPPPLPQTEPDAPMPIPETSNPTEFVRSLSRTPAGYSDNGGYGEGVPVLNRKTSAPVMPYGSSPRISEEKETAPSVRRKSSELSLSMKSRLEAFTKNQDDENNANKRIVEPDNAFREKLQTFRKISEPQPEEEVPKGPKPPLSYKTLIGNNFQQSQTSIEHEKEPLEEELDDVDQLLDDALEESYRSVLEDESRENSLKNPEDPDLGGVSPGGMAPPTEKPPPPPPSEIQEEYAKNQRNLQKNREDEDIDKQEQEIIASLEKEEREHKKYMDTVNAMRNLSPTSSASSSHESGSRVGPQPFGKKSMSPTFRNVSPGPGLSPDSRPPTANSNSPIKKKTPETTPNNQGAPQNRPYNQQHWLIQEAERRRISEQQMRHYQQEYQNAPAHNAPAHNAPAHSPVYENSNYLGGMPQNAPQVPQNGPQMPPHVPPPSQQYTNHQRPPTSNSTSSLSRFPNQQQPSPNENMYANLGQHPPLPANYQRDIPPGPPQPSNSMRGLPGPQVPPRNPQPGGGESSSANGGSTDRLLSVSGKKKCSHCKEELGRGAAMIIESLRLFYHLRCFRCVVCHVQLGNGSTGTDVRVRNNKLHCQNCYSNDEGLKFSKV